MIHILNIDLHKTLLLQIIIDWVLYLITNCTWIQSKVLFYITSTVYTVEEGYWPLHKRYCLMSASCWSARCFSLAIFHWTVSLAHHRLHFPSSTHTLAQLCTHGQCRHSIFPQSLRSSKIAQRTLVIPVLSSGLPWQHIYSTRSTPFRWG